MIYTLLHRSAKSGHRPIPDGTEDVLAERIHRLPEPPVDGRTLRLLHPVLQGLDRLGVLSEEAGGFFRQQGALVSSVFVQLEHLVPSGMGQCPQ